MKFVKFDYDDIFWNPPLVSIILFIDDIVVLHWRMYTLPWPCQNTNQQ
jgi:hypothetical protein